MIVKKMTKNKGFGVFTTERILHNEVVFTFIGKISSTQDKHSLQVSPSFHLHTCGVCKYTNHSCKPNCIVKNSVDLVAIRNIKHDEEITFDYSTTEAHLNMKCLCGSKNCRKIIKGYDD